MNENIYIENYRKRAGGKVYRNVRFRLCGTYVEVPDLVTDSDEKALERAKEILKKAIEL